MVMVKIKCPLFLPIPLCQSISHSKFSNVGIGFGLLGHDLHSKFGVSCPPCVVKIMSLRANLNNETKPSLCRAMAGHVFFIVKC